MILLTILLTPLAIAALFIVMSWTERALDHQSCRAGAPTSYPTAAVADSPVVAMPTPVETVVT